MIRLLGALEGASAEVRFFVLIWFRHFGVESKLSMKVAEMAEIMGVSKTVVSESLSYLTRKVFFEQTTELKYSRRGRPTPEYIVSDRLLSILSEHEIPMLHIGLVNELLDLRPPSFHRTNLKLSNRLLLCVFLLHADQFGAVQDLGFATIAALTGMSNDQFKSQLDKLTRLGYIRIITPGVTSRHLFGSRASLYLLNVTVERFACASLRSLTCEQAIGYEHEKMLDILIERSLGCLTEYRNAQREEDADRKKRRLEIFEIQKAKFENLACTENPERSWNLFVELRYRPDLRAFLYEKILLVAAQQVFSRKKDDEGWIEELTVDFCKELEPRFEKRNAIKKDRTSTSGAVAEKGEADCGELESKFTDDSDPFNSWNLVVFSQVLVNCIVVDLIQALENKMATLEKHFDRQFLFGFILKEEILGVVTIKAPRSIFGLYPVSEALDSKRVYINADEVHELDVSRQVE
jgi:DNA-binding Lrp family transcriptional regulator